MSKTDPSPEFLESEAMVALPYAITEALDSLEIELAEQFSCVDNRGVFAVMLIKLALREYRPKVIGERNNVGYCSAPIRMKAVRMLVEKIVTARLPTDLLDVMYALDQKEYQAVVQAWQPAFHTDDYYDPNWRPF